MNLHKLARTAIKSTLEASPTYQALTQYPGFPGIYRTFGEQVPPSVPLPYVTIEWYAGGLDNDAPTEASSSLWKVVAHTEEDEALADEIASAIYEALHKNWPVSTGNTKFAGYAPIYLKYPFMDTVIRQSRSLIRVGGIYAVYLAQVRG